MNDEPPSRSCTCDTTVLGGDWAATVPSPEANIERAVAAALARVPGHRLPRGPSEVSLVLADDATVRQLNRDYRGKDKPTNVLSFAEADAEFPATPDMPAHLGDVVLALETVLAEAGAQAKTPADHLAHLAVHGLLHLLDYDHERGDDEARTMEALEVAILADLGIADPYADEDAVTEGSA